MQEQIQQFQGSVDTFSEKFKQAIDDQVQLLEEEDDAIAARIGEVFDIGEEYSFDRMMEIASEGAFRYQEQIPPGYMDAKEKIGLAKYGDLFLWKQILDKAASTGQDLLLVINDIKPDWQDKQTEMPRTELLQEYASASDRRFWTLTLKDFIYRINGRLQSQMPEEVLKEIEQSNTDVPEARDFFTGDLWRDRVQELLFEEDGMVQIVSEITGEEWDSSDTFRVFEGIHAQGGRVAVILMITEGMMQQRHARAAMYGAFNLRRILMEKHLTYQYRFICVCEDDINAARAGAYSRTLTENAMPDEGVMWCDFGYVNGKGSITVVEVNHAMG